MRLKIVAAGFLAATLIACSGGEVDQTPPPLSVERLVELRWIAEDADAVEVLTMQPATCLTTPASKDARDLILYGELVFNSPLLIGGQASKAGLSCASCHRNGRDNPTFVFDTVSGVPGTADISHGLFGFARADNVHNPVPIPDLAAPTGKLIVDRNDSDALLEFLAAQIVEEFSGQEASPIVLQSLIAYLQALDISACEGNDVSEPVSWQVEAYRVRNAILAVDTYGSLDWESSEAFAYAGRAALERLHIRYAAGEHETLRDELIALSKLLGDKAAPNVLLPKLDVLEVQLDTQAATSLYDPDTLRRALAAR